MAFELTIRTVLLILGLTFCAELIGLIAEVSVPKPIWVVVGLLIWLPMVIGMVATARSKRPFRSESPCDSAR